MFQKLDLIPLSGERVEKYLLSWLGLTEGAVSSHCTGMYPLFREIENCGTPVHNFNHIAFIMRCESKDIITKGLCVTFPVRLVACQELFNMPLGQTLGTESVVGAKNLPKYEKVQRGAESASS